MNNLVYSESDEKDLTFNLIPLLESKISSLKLKGITEEFFQKMFSDLQKEIEEMIPLLEGESYDPNFYIDYLIKRYIFENYSIQIFYGEDDLYRLYMYVFDPFGDDYFNIFSKIYGQDMIYSRENEELVKKTYMEHLKLKFMENQDFFNTNIGEFLRNQNQTGFDYMPKGSKKMKMRDVIIKDSIRCPTNSVKIVHGHGSIIPGEVFRIPSGAKVITLSQTNVCIPHMSHGVEIKDVFVPFMKLYMDGGSIFENDDSIKKINIDFENLIDYYKKKGGEYIADEMDPYNHLNFQYGLHLPGDIIPDMYIQTEGTGCNTLFGGYDGCNIICFEKGEPGVNKEDNNYLNYIKFVVDGKETFQLENNDKRFTTISKVLEEMGDGTYIIYACRYTGEQNYELSRTLSNTVRGPGYDKKPFRPINDDGIYMLSSIKQPNDIDSKKIYRYHIEFLENHVDLKTVNEVLKKENHELETENEELETENEELEKVNEMLKKENEALKKENEMLLNRLNNVIVNKGGGKKTKKKSRR